MRTPSLMTTTERAEPGANVPPARRRRRRLMVSVPLLALLIVGVTITALRRSEGSNGGAGTPVGSGVGTSLAEVEQRPLSSQTQVDGTLGYAGDVDVVNQADGTVTALPALGQVVNQGEVLYRVNGAPVVLLYGATPAYRDLAAGASASDVAGPDVQQFNAALVALGYATAAELDPASDQFSWRTRQAVKKLQAALGVEQTGALALGQVVFLPSAVRVTAVAATLGAPAQPGTTVVEATSTTPVVTVELGTARQSQVRVGDAVTITLPNLATTGGTVSSVSSVAASSDDGGDEATIRVEIILTDPAGAAGLDQAPVLVAITTAAVDNALVVPVTALLALAGGGYAVEIADADGTRRLVPVELGVFDDASGLVQVTGSGVQAGEQVVVPST
ncbi:MAG: efflux RND transporter periplasmic adaptor subunit [Acidimicrobiales bacterium]